MLLDAIRVDEYVIQVYVHEAANDIVEYRCH
jgi:hypothetical protein